MILALSLYGPSTAGIQPKPPASIRKKSVNANGDIQIFKLENFSKRVSCVFLSVFPDKYYLGNNGGVQKESCNSCSSKLDLSSKVGHALCYVSCIMSCDMEKWHVFRIAKQKMIAVQQKLVICNNHLVLERERSP